MRKLISLFLVLAMLLSFSVTAFAAETEDRTATANENSDYKASIDVNGKYISQLDSDKIISVDVAWQDMNFIYYGSQEGTWNPTTHTYDGEKTATWNKTTSDITVTNHSNLEVTANLSYTQSVTSVTGNLSATSLTLESAAQDKYMGENADKAPSATSTFTIGGTMNKSSAKDLGTITVALKEGSSAGDTENKGDGDDGIEWTEVSTFDALKTALEAGGNIKMMCNITTEEDFPDSQIASDASFQLDLNGNKLTLYQLLVGRESTVSNGTIVSNASMCAPIQVQSKNFLIENCTLIGKNYYGLYLIGGSATVKDTTLDGGVCLQFNSTLTATENVTVTKDQTASTTGVSVLKNSTATFSFDPSSILDAYNNGTVTDNGNGTWTVTAP